MWAAGCEGAPQVNREPLERLLHIFGGKIDTGNQLKAVKLFIPGSQREHVLAVLC